MEEKIEAVRTDSIEINQPSKGQPSFKIKIYFDSEDDNAEKTVVDKIEFYRDKIKELLNI